MKYYYEKNTYLLEHSTNKTFEELLWMSSEEFHQWCVDVRKAVVYSWDTLGIPPVVGKNEEEFLDGVEKIIGYNTTEFSVKDDDGNKNVIRNTQTELSGILGGFFPTLMKVRINYTTDSSKGVSIYDFFADDKLLPRFEKYAKRHFKRDSFYAFSAPVRVGDDTHLRDYPSAKAGSKWIEEFEDKYRKIGEWDYWLAPAEEENSYTGYKEELRDRVNLGVTDKDPIWTICPKKCQTNVDWAKSLYYQIRVFPKGQKVFPAGFKFWRISFCQVPAIFPPLTAKYLYERYLPKSNPDGSPLVILDPSLGWGSRLCGAMALTGRNVVFVGTDPNTDHNTTKGRTKYHEIADFMIQKTSKANSLIPDTTEYEFYQCGSENLADDSRFEKWRGNVNLVFSSPPYWNREAYSEDENQSYKKFDAYESWVEGFLKPTLEMCVEWLRPEGILLWNIANLKIGNGYLPLEEDSWNILSSLGMNHIETLKMTLAAMPGSGRVDENGKPKARNSVKVKGNWMRYEPITVWVKG